MSKEYDALRAAITSKKPVRCLYKGQQRDVCPHVIGLKHGREKVLTFQYAGYSSSGLPPGGEWRCMFIDEVSDVFALDGAWHTGANHSRPQTCVDQIDIEVAF